MLHCMQLNMTNIKFGLVVAIYVDLLITVAIEVSFG